MKTEQIKNIEYKPSKDLKKSIQEIWQQVLNLSEVGINDNFFDLGGHSLNAVEILARVKEEKGIELSMLELLECPTVAEMVLLIERAEKPQSETGKRELARGEEIIAESKYACLNQKKELSFTLKRELTAYLRHGFALSILLWDKRMYPWYYQKFVQICSQTNDNGYMILDYAEPEYDQNVIETAKVAGYGEFSGNIIDYILETVNSGLYVVICLDEYYLESKKSFNIKHFVHESIVYGYDSVNQKILAAGFNSDMIFSKLEFSYAEFAQAFEAGRLHYNESAPYAQTQAVILLRPKIRSVSFDLNVFINELSQYVDSKWYPERVMRVFSGTVSSQERFNSKIQYGLEVYNGVLQALEDLKNGKWNLDFRAFHLLAEHKKIMHEKFLYISQTYSFGKELNELFGQYEMIAETFEGLRRKSMRLNFSDRPLSETAELISQTLDLIKDMKAKEENVILKIIEILKKYCEGGTAANE